MDDINLDVLAIDGEVMLKELSEGKMVIARSKNDFIYIVAYDDNFHMFTHTAGDEGGSQKQFPVDEQNTAIVRKVAELSDSVFKAEFNQEYNLYGVMSTVEEAILELFPGDDRDLDGTVDFGLPDDAG